MIHRTDRIGSLGVAAGCFSDNSDPQRQCQNLDNNRQGLFLIHTTFTRMLLLCCACTHKKKNCQLPQCSVFFVRVHSKKENIVSYGVASIFTLCNLQTIFFCVCVRCIFYAKRNHRIQTFRTTMCHFEIRSSCSLFHVSMARNSIVAANGARLMCFCVAVHPLTVM